MARDSSSGFRQGHHTFLYGHKKYNWGSGRKRTNEQYGLRSAPSARRVVLWHFFVQLFVHFVDYRGRIFFVKLLQKPLGMPTHLWPSSSLPPSADRCRLPLCVSLRQLTLFGLLCQLTLFGFLCQLTLSGFLCQFTLSGFLCQLPSGFSRTCLSSPTSGLVGDLELRHLLSFAPKQRNRLPGLPPTECHKKTVTSKLFGHIFYQCGKSNILGIIC